MKKTLVGFFIGVLVLTSIVVGYGVIVQTNSPNLRTDVEFHRALGDEFTRRGEITRAVAIYEDLLKIKDDLEVRNNLAVLYFNLKEHQKAVDNLRVLLASDQSNPSFHYDLAVNLVEEYRSGVNEEESLLSEALKHYEIAESLRPGYAQANSNALFLKKMLSG